MPPRPASADPDPPACPRGASPPPAQRFYQPWTRAGVLASVEVTVESPERFRGQPRRVAVRRMIGSGRYGNTGADCVLHRRRQFEAQPVDRRGFFRIFTYEVLVRDRDHAAA